MRNKIYSIFISAAALLFFVGLSCGKENVDLHNLLTSQQWYLYYYSIDKGDKVIYATEYQYRIQFLDKDSIKVFKQSGAVMTGRWEINNNFMYIDIVNSPELTGKWEMVEYKVWGYDQDRIVFKNNNIEIGLN